MENIRRITDLWFATFLKCEGYELVDFELKGRGKGIYIFSIEDKDYKELRLKFFKSDIGKAKQTMEMLKDMCY